MTRNRLEAAPCGPRLDDPLGSVPEDRRSINSQTFLALPQVRALEASLGVLVFWACDRVLTALALSLHSVERTLNTARLNVGTPRTVKDSPA